MQLPIRAPCHDATAFTDWSTNVGTPVLFYDNFRKCTTIYRFSLLELGISADESIITPATSPLFCNHPTCRKTHTADV